MGHAAKILSDAEMPAVTVTKNVALPERLVSRGIKEIAKIATHPHFVFINTLVEGTCFFVYARVNIRAHYFRIGGELGCFLIVYLDAIFPNTENINLMGLENNNNIVVFRTFDVDRVFFLNESVAQIVVRVRVELSAGVKTSL